MTYPLAPVAAPERMADLPMHVIGYSACLNCGETYEPTTDEAYEAYVEHWYANEYEGVVIHSDGGRWDPRPESYELFVWLRSSCLGAMRLDA